MFLIEGLPAILLGFAVYRFLTELPRETTWLKEDERTWLLAQLESERIESERKFGSAQQTGSIWQAIFSLRIWMLSLVYFGVSTTMYGVTLWLPSLIRELSGISYFLIGMVATIPFLVAAVVMVIAGKHSDRTGERRWHVALPAFAAAAALLLAGYANSVVLMIACLAVGLAGVESMVGPFWAMATSRMTGLSAAAGIAVINSLANLGGYFGPDIIGAFRTSNGGFRGGLIAIGATVTVSGITALIVGRESKVEMT
jgi:ACS family tartrate transporter-like MFS transporter